MTKKHFERIAATIASLFLTEPTFNEGKLYIQGSNDSLKLLAKLLAMDFAEFNKCFDRQKFLDAAIPEDHR